MNSDLERRLRTSLQVSAKRIDPSPDLGSRMVRLGREVRRRRRTTVSLSATALAAVLVSAVVLVVSGPFRSGPPITTPPPSQSPSGLPSPTPSPSASTTPPPPTVWPRALSILDIEGTIHTIGGARISVPVPATTPVVRATEVAGGWVVDVNDSDTPTAVRTTSFLTADGSLRSFNLPTARFQYAFSPDRTRMVTYAQTTLTVFELPSLRVLDTVDTTGQPFGQPTALWLRGDRVIVQHLGMGDGGGPTGVNVWNLNTGEGIGSADVVLGDVSTDGTTGVLQRWPVGTTVGCIAVVPFTDNLVAEGDMFCDADGHNLTVVPESLSPDGQWVAVSTTALQAENGVYFSDVLVYRVSEIQTGTAQPSGYRDQFPEDGHAYDAAWATGNRVVIYEERLHWVLVCAAATGECEEVSLPASARAVVG